MASMRLAHLKNEERIGKTLWRVWYSELYSRQEDLFSPSNRRFVDGKEFNLISSVSPGDKSYKNNPYPEYKDKVFIGFYTPDELIK